MIPYRVRKARVTRIDNAEEKVLAVLTTGGASAEAVRALHYLAKVARTAKPMDKEAQKAASLKWREKQALKAAQKAVIQFAPAECLAPPDQPPPEAA